MSSRPKNLTLSPKPGNHTAPPFKLFKQIFCKNCPEQNFSNTNKETKQLCILALLADETARLRQTIQERNQHLSW